MSQEGWVGGSAEVSTWEGEVEGDEVGGKRMGQCDETVTVRAGGMGFAKQPRRQAGYKIREETGVLLL